MTWLNCLRPDEMVLDKMVVDKMPSWQICVAPLILLAAKLVGLIVETVKYFQYKIPFKSIIYLQNASSRVQTLKLRIMSRVCRGMIEVQKYFEQTERKSYMISTN